MTKYNNTVYFRGAKLPLPMEEPRQTLKHVSDENREEIEVCLNCKKEKCNGGEDCMRRRLENREIAVKKAWTQDEKDYLIKNYTSMSIEEIALALSKTSRAVKRMVKILGI